VKFYGVTITAENKIWMVTELMDASLEKFIKILSPSQRLAASLQITKAM
jgi:hypothetical protein